MNIKDIAVEHPYYCSDQNYYSNDPNQHYETMAEFLDEFEDADVDLNLCFRWDITLPDPEWDDDEDTSADVFLMLQRKGIFMPIHIDKILDSDVDRFVAYLAKHKAVIDAIWTPIVAKSEEK